MILSVDEFRAGAGIDFDLDPFQTEAIGHLAAGRSVLVAAPTGSGKTLVAEYGVAAALGKGNKAFYTTPIKALSNQKYRDLARRHGPEAVGLLTGDNVINPEAPVVVMTTEVLRNMIYARSELLGGLEVVVLDEVHYLQDAYRGPVWEEVIIHLPAPVRLVCLSATVSNADELAGWIESVRGPTASVVEHERPVDLDNLYLVGDRSSDELHLLPTLVGGRPNPEGSRFDADGRARGRGRSRRRWFTPDRLDTVDVLDERGMLPAIYFVFSRAGCDESARRCRDGARRLTDEHDRRAIESIVEAHVEGLSDSDLAVLDHAGFLATLLAGYAPHHAGLIPPFKEAVEECFVAGHVGVVFATETLALGINMPARSVVIDRLTKFTGEGHDLLTPGQYSQITGRAGRRGIDDHGYAVVPWSPFVPFAQVAGLAASREFVLRSSFRPTYNMAANLVADYPPDEAHRLLSSSFAQYQTDLEIARLRERFAQRQAELDEVRERARCERGDVEEYDRLRRRAGERSRSPRRAVEEACAALRPGDVVDLPAEGRAAVLSVAHRKRSVRIRVVSDEADVVTVRSSDLEVAPRVLGTVDLPVPFEPSSPAFVEEVAAAMHRLRAAPAPRATPAGDDAEQDEVHDHPVHACPDRDRHLRAQKRVRRLSTRLTQLEREIDQRADSLVRQFDRVLQLLEAWGYLEGWALTAQGDALTRVFHECDLVVAEAVRRGVFAELDPPGLAALVSCLTYEQRSSEEPPPPRWPSPELRERWEELEEIGGELEGAEDAVGLELTRRLDPGLAEAVYAWAAGDDLDEVLDADDDLTAGDFVRNIKQVVDLTRQLRELGDPALARVADRAVGALSRGVVAVSSALEGRA